MKNILIFIFLFFTFENADAADDCFLRDGGVAPVTINASQLIIPGSIPVGGTIFKQEYSYDSVGTHQAVSCGDSGTVQFNYVTNMSGTVSSNANTYNTNIPGIGIRISMYVNQPYGDFPTTPTYTPFTIPITVFGDSGAAFGSGYQYIIVELIKTSDIISAGSLVYSVPDFSFASSSNQLQLANFNFNADIVVPSCSVNPLTPTTLDMGTTSNYALRDVGSTSNEKDFSIVLDCTGEPNINLTLSGNEDSTALNMGVLSPDNSSTATGFGVQILYKNMPVIFNKPFSVGTASGGQFTIPMSVRFYKTKSNLTPGEFSSFMTYVLTYM